MSIIKKPKHCITMSKEVNGMALKIAEKRLLKRNLSSILELLVIEEFKRRKLVLKE